MRRALAAVRELFMNTIVSIISDIRICADVKLMNAVRSPTAIVPPIICRPPNQITARIVKFITSIIAGIIMITTLSARMVVFFRSPFAWANRSFSKSSRTNDLMTRTFVRSSWILLFRPSIFACIRVNRGKPVRTTVTMITASSGIETAVHDGQSEGSAKMVAISAPISTPGARSTCASAC